MHARLLNSRLFGDCGHYHVNDQYSNREPSLCILQHAHQTRLVGHVEHHQGGDMNLNTGFCSIEWKSNTIIRYHKACWRNETASRKIWLNKSPYDPFLTIQLRSVRTSAWSQSRRSSNWKGWEVIWILFQDFLGDHLARFIVPLKQAQGQENSQPSCVHWVASVFSSKATKIAHSEWKPLHAFPNVSAFFACYPNLTQADYLIPAGQVKSLNWGCQTC